MREELYRVREEGGRREGRDREEGRMVEGKKETLKRGVGERTYCRREEREKERSKGSRGGKEERRMCGGKGGRKKDRRKCDGGKERMKGGMKERKTIGNKKMKERAPRVRPGRE